MKGSQPSIQLSRAAPEKRWNAMIHTAYRANRLAPSSGLKLLPDGSDIIREWSHLNRKCVTYITTLGRPANFFFVAF